MTPRPNAPATGTTRIPKRLRVLARLDDAPHRYGRLRTLLQVISIVVLGALPVVGVGRFDLWAGHHLALFAPAPAFIAFFGVLVGLFVVYLPTFVVNAVLGRVFCGFGCPVGHTARLADAVEVGRRMGKRRLRAEAIATVHAMALAAAAGLWWIDPRVFSLGSAKAIALVVASWIALAATIRLFGARWRWGFCMGYCPIGIYYTVVHTSHRFGVHLENPKACRGCRLCAAACPIELDPRSLTRILDGWPERNHCLECGDCVRACELVFERRGARGCSVPRAPLALGQTTRPSDPPTAK